ncbi:uncharacterized protein LOC141620871 [Silene latifolia]|uniref:uncharacterized protein LOC141620871 n=1 Tax=Silene latifolia TaxID=37657 RepID=UPI003D789CD6
MRGGERAQWQMNNFRAAVEDYGLRDLDFEGYDFTYNNGQEGDDNRQCRLDRAMMNETWRDLFPYAKLTQLDREWLDHGPLKVNLDARVEGFEGHKKKFKFEQIWVGPSVVRMALQVLNGAPFPAGLNTTQIILIPKKKAPDKLGDFRPISLCNVLYKIISKVLANRLKMFVGELISENQRAFTPGRLITDNILIAFEMFYYTKNSRGAGGHMALKLDMSKPYERVEWDFLEQDKLSKQLQGWRGMLFSKAGKETLIKAVAQAMPTYAMSVFKIPTIFCDELRSMVSAFWWGSDNGRRKMPWVAWSKMCKPKCRGGLDFRDFAKFNKALLGKQDWRLMTNDTCLMARVLKGKYFGDRSFVDAELGHNPSYTWRRI